MKFVVKGKNKSVEIEAQSADSARKIAISEYGIYPLKISQKSANFLAQSTPKFSLKNLFSTSISHKDLHFIFLQFHIMLSAFLPLNLCLENVKNSLEKRSIFSSKNALFNALNSIIFLVHSGHSLSAAFARHKNIFGDLAASIIEVGEKSGNLALAFEKLSKIEEIKSRQNTSIKKALIYPSILFFSMCVAFFVILAFVIPEFENIFIQFGKELPIYTQILLWLNTFIERFGVAILLVLIALIIALKSLHFLSAKIAFYLDFLLLNLPFVAPLLSLKERYNFLLSLSILEQSKMPLDKSVELAKNSVKNLFFRAKIDEVVDGILKGKSLSNSIAKIDGEIIDSVSLNLIRSGEVSGNVGAMLEAAQERLEKMLEDKIAALILFLEPTLSLFLGTLLLFLALGVFVPIWDLSAV